MYGGIDHRPRVWKRVRGFVFCTGNVVNGGIRFFKVKYVIASKVFISDDIMQLKQKGNKP